MKHFRRFLAFINRTFVTDCPRCLKHFYGHEGHGVQINMKDNTGKPTHYRYVCPSCVKQHRGM